MWWKRAFIVLFGLNLLVGALFLIIWNTFPNASQPPAQTPPSAAKNAPSVEVVIGQDAVNAYLAYALQHEADVSQIVSAAHVEFASDWDCDFSVNVLGKAIPFHLVITPIIENGNMLLHVRQASMGVVPIPNPFLFSVLSRARFPSWISPDASHDNLQINFAKRQQGSFGVRAVSYSAKAQELTMKLMISPSDLIKSPASHT